MSSAALPRRCACVRLASQLRLWTRRSQCPWHRCSPWNCWLAPSSAQPSASVKQAVPVAWQGCCQVLPALAGGSRCLQRGAFLALTHLGRFGLSSLSGLIRVLAVLPGRVGGLGSGVHSLQVCSQQAERRRQQQCWQPCQVGLGRRDTWGAGVWAQ